MKKLAVVRNNTDSSCPFGLSIPSACKCAGNNINNLAPVSIANNEQESESIINANKRFLAWNLSNSAEEIQKCVYADVLIDNSDSVVCNYGDSAPGVGQAALFSPPFYTKMMSNNIMGLQSYPISYYGDYNISRNMYYGIFSLQGFVTYNLQKLAKDMERYGGAFVLFYCQEDNSVLLLNRTNEGIWGFPGGKLEKGENPQEGALREMEEEIGFVPNAFDVISWGAVVIDEQCALFIVSINKDTKEKWDDVIKLNHEHTDFKWFDLGKIPNNLHSIPKLVFGNAANIQEY